MKKESIVNNPTVWDKSTERNQVQNHITYDRVMETYPSFTEIITDPKYKFQYLVGDVDRFMMRRSRDKWGYVSTIVDKICVDMYGLGFYKSHCFYPTKDPFDYDTGLNVEGTSKVYCSKGDIHEVDYETFLKLTLVMYMSFMGIQLTDEQYDSYLKFRDSSSTVWTILD